MLDGDKQRAHQHFARHENLVLDQLRNPHGTARRNYPGASATAIPLIAYVEPRQGLSGLYLILAGFAALTFVAALIFPRTPAHSAVGQVA